MISNYIMFRTVYLIEFYILNSKPFIIVFIAFIELFSFLLTPSIISPN